MIKIVKISFIKDKGALCVLKLHCTEIVFPRVYKQKKRWFFRRKTSASFVANAELELTQARIY